MKLKIKFEDVLHFVACLLCAFVVSAIIAHLTITPTPAIVDASGRLKHNPDLGYYYYYNDPGGPCVPVTIDMTNLLIEE